MEFYLVWGLVCAITAALIAGNKGRSRGGWAVLGFFFSLIAVLIVSCLPSLYETPKRRVERAVAPPPRWRLIGAACLAVGAVIIAAILGSKDNSSPIDARPASFKEFADPIKSDDVGRLGRNAGDSQWTREDLKRGWRIVR